MTKSVKINPGSEVREFRLVAGQREIRRHVGETPEPLMGFAGANISIQFKSSHGWINISGEKK